MMPQFNLGLLAPQGDWGQTTASFPNAELGGMQMPQGGLFAPPQMPPFIPHGNINPSDLMAQIGLGGNRVGDRSKTLDNIWERARANRSNRNRINLQFYRRD